MSPTTFGYLDGRDWDSEGVVAPWASGDTPDQHRAPSNGIPGIPDEYDGNDLGSVAIVEDKVDAVRAGT